MTKEYGYAGRGRAAQVFSVIMGLGMAYISIT